jgi:chromosome segregation ATPase
MSAETELDRLDGRIDDVQEQLRALVESPAFDAGLRAANERIDQLAARVRELERQTNR